MSVLAAAVMVATLFVPPSLLPTGALAALSFFLFGARPPGCGAGRVCGRDVGRGCLPVAGVSGLWGAVGGDPGVAGEPVAGIADDGRLDKILNNIANHAYWTGASGQLDLHLSIKMQFAGCAGAIGSLSLPSCA